MKKKRFLSMLLVLCIIFEALPTNLFAAGSMPFTDVKETDLYYDAVKYVHENGMMSGTGMNLFSPDATTTRGMIVTILHRIEGEIPNFTGKFKDVPSGKYYSDAVEWASANGIVGGYGNGKFGPDDTITREQMVTILYRYAQYKGYSTAIGGSISSFSDGNQVSPYAYEAMSWAIGLGSISTIGNNKLAPKSGATRAQVASALMKLHKFSAPTYHTVTFKYNHNNMGVYKTVSVQSGAILKELTDPEISGYSFGGWYTKEIGGVEFNLNSPIYEDIVLYANWFKKESDQSVSSSAVSKQSSVVPSPSVPYYPFPWQPPADNSTLKISITNPDYSEETSGIITQDDTYTLTGVVENGNISRLDATYHRYEEPLTAGKVEGLNSWHVKIPLKIGTNVVVLTGYDVGGGTVTKEVHINRINKELKYSDKVKVADAEDYSRLRDDFISLRVDDNNTEDRSDDSIVILAKDSALLLSQIKEGLLSKGDIYTIRRNELFLTGFTAVYQYHRAPVGTENYPITEYPDDGYEEIVFSYADFFDLFEGDISLDLSGSIDPENPIAFAIRADGTPFDLQPKAIDVSGAYGLYQEDMVSVSDYPRAGWQPEELLKNIIPRPTIRSDENNIGSVSVDWDEIVIYDADGKKDTKDKQVTLSGKLGASNIRHYGIIEKAKWKKPRCYSKCTFDLGISAKVKGNIEKISTEEFVKMANARNKYGRNDKYENKAEWNGKLFSVSVSGVKAFKDKIVLGVIGYNMLKKQPVITKTIKDASEKAVLDVMPIVFVYLNTKGEVELGGELSFSANKKVAIGGKIRSGDVQSLNSVDDEPEGGNLSASIRGGIESTLDLGGGVGVGVMVSGVVPITADGKAYYHAEGKAKLGPKGELKFFPGAKKEGVKMEWSGLDVDVSLKHGFYSKLSFAARVLAEVEKKGTVRKFGGKIEALCEKEFKFWEQNIYCLKGFIRDEGDKSPISNAVIELVNIDHPSKFYKKISYSSGGYEFVLPNGKYKLKVTKDGYGDYVQEIDLSSGSFNLDILLKKQDEIGGDCTLTGRITIADKDTDLTNNKPLEGVDVVVRSGGGVVKTARTDSSGMYEIKNLPPGVYTVRLSKSGYMTTEQKIIIKSGENKRYNREIEKISEEFSGVGKAVGLISDAVTGKGIPGLTLRIRKGIDNADGEIIATLKTDSAGGYLFEGEAGHYTIEIVDERSGVKEKYVTGVFNIKILGNTKIGQQNATVSKELTKEQLRVVLTWGKQPLDLDSHMYGPTSKGGLFHIYFRNMRYKDEGVEVDLDLDDTTSYGPETTTIRKVLSGKYRFIVHDYTNRGRKTSDALGKSGAIVKVYLDGKEYAFNVPPISGTIWEVFEYDSNTRTITPVNKAGFEGSGGKFGDTLDPMEIEFEKMELEEKYYE